MIDDTASKASDRRLPCQLVVFNGPMSLPGTTATFTQVEAGVRRIVNGKEWVAPPIWFDGQTRTIVIDGRTFPLESVRYFDRAKMALTREPPPLVTPDYTIGKDARRKK